MAELQRQTSKPALVRNSSTNADRLSRGGRRIAFEVPSHRRNSRHRSGLSDIDTSIDHIDKSRSCCFACCAWSCFFVFIIIVVVLFAGISYLAFLQSGMPKVNVRSLNITKLQIDESQNKLDAVISLGLRVSNKNEKIILLYGPLSMFVTSERVTLGQTRVGGFSQKPQNDTDFWMKITLENADVNRYAVDELKSDMNAKEVVYDVYMSGKIGFKVGSLQMINVPFLSSCRQIKQMDVDFGRRPGCDVKMFAFRPSNN